MVEFSPKVSVLIITYNQQDLIADTLDSVLKQDYPNLEIVVSDDASTDSTLEIVYEYALNHSELVIIENPVNLGITGNSNKALEATTGELVAIMGGDDLFLSGKISAQVKLFSDNNVVLSYHAVEVFDSISGQSLYISNMTSREDLTDVYKVIEKVGIPGSSSVMVRKSACPIHGFDPLLPIVSDWIFFIEVAMKGRIAKLDGVYGRYRKHRGGVTEKQFDLLEESLRTLTIILERYPNDKKLITSCRKGRYRYLLGELYRQVDKRNQDNIVTVINLLMKNTNLIHQFLLVILSTALKNRFVLGLVGFILNKFKNRLRRI